MKNLEKFKVQELSEQEMMKIDGGRSWKDLAWMFAKEIAEAYVSAYEGYVEACGNGTYEGIPGCRR